MAADPALSLGRDLAEDANRAAKAPEPWYKGVVQSFVYGSGVLPLVTVRPTGAPTDGSADCDMPFIDSYDPQVGDVVICGRIYGSPFVLGRTKPDNDRQKLWREITFPNGADLTSATFVDILTFTAIPVPLWARNGTAKAEIMVDTQGAIITAAGQFQIRVVADSTNGTTVGLRGDGVNSSQWVARAGISYTIPASATTIAVKLQGLRVNPPGTGGWRTASSVNPIATVDALIHIP
jgi:hypothetical protein